MSGGIERDTSLRREVSPFTDGPPVDTGTGCAARRKSHFTRSREGQVTRVHAASQRYELRVPVPPSRAVQTLLGF